MARGAMVSSVGVVVEVEARLEFRRVERNSMAMGGEGKNYQGRMQGGF